MENLIVSCNVKFGNVEIVEKIIVETVENIVEMRCRRKKVQKCGALAMIFTFHKLWKVLWKVCELLWKADSMGIERMPIF